MKTIGEPAMERNKRDQNAGMILKF